MPLAEKNGIALFLPETYDIVWSLVILVVIAVCFYKYIMPKFQAVFDARAAKIEGRMEQAEKTLTRPRRSMRISSVRRVSRHPRSATTPVPKHPISSLMRVRALNPMQPRSLKTRSARLNPSKSRLW